MDKFTHPSRDLYLLASSPHSSMCRQVYQTRVGPASPGSALVACRVRGSGRSLLSVTDAIFSREKEAEELLGAWRPLQRVSVLQGHRPGRPIDPGKAQNRHSRLIFTTNARFWSAGKPVTPVSRPSVYTTNSSLPG